MQLRNIFILNTDRIVFFLLLNLLFSVCVRCQMRNATAQLSRPARSQLFHWRCMLCTINQCNADIGQVCQSNIYIHIVGLIFTFSFSSEEIKEMTTKCILCYDLCRRNKSVTFTHCYRIFATAIAKKVVILEIIPLMNDRAPALTSKKKSGDFHMRGLETESRVLDASKCQITVYLSWLVRKLPSIDKFRVSLFL